MSLMNVLIQSGAAGDTVRLPQIANLSNSGDSGTIYSGLKFDGDGGIYRRNYNGGWSFVTTWLVSGSAASFYLFRTVDSGTLTTDAGAGPLQLNSDRIYDVQLDSDGSNTAKVSFTVSNSTTGSPVLAGSTQYTFNVNFTSN